MQSDLLTAESGCAQVAIRTTQGKELGTNWEQVVNESGNERVTGTALVAELALHLHQTQRRELHINIPKDSLITKADLPSGCRVVDEMRLEFDSLLARNIIIAQATFEELHSANGISSDALFERAYELWRDEIGHNDQASGRLLSLASGSVDVVSAAARRIRNGSNVFEVLHLVEAALPHLETIEASSIIELLSAKFEPTKNDMARGVINGALETWLETRPDYARKIHTTVLSDLTEATASLAGNAIVALAKSDHAAAVEIARSDVKEGIPLLSQVGCWTLGRLLLVEHAPSESIDIAVKIVIELIDSEKSALRSEAIRAAVGAMHVVDAFDDVLHSLARVDDQEVLCSAATALFLKANELRERDITQRWLELMSALRPEFKGAIRDLDHAMAQLISDPANVPMVTSTLSQWVLKHGQKLPIDSETAELFGDTVRELSASKETWASLVTDWLLSSAGEHAAALAGMLTQLSHNEKTDLRLDKLRLDDLSIEDLLFLARRMIGYVYDRAQLTSLALSMLKSTDATKRIYPVLYPLLVDEIGYDYPESTSEACRSAAEANFTRDHKEFLVRVADAIDQALEAQTALPIRNEFRPPSRLRRLFARARAIQMNESLEASRGNSILRQFANQVSVKAGQGAFSYRDANYGPSMKFASMSHSIELPRREAFDPIGNSIRHFRFRLAKREMP